MDKTEKTYQLTLFLSPLLDESGVKETIQKITQYIVNKQGSIKQAPDFGSSSEDRISIEKFKKSLAYPIEKNREVFSFELIFELGSEMTKVLINLLNQEKDVVRHMLLSHKEEPLEKISESKLDEKIESLIDQEIPLIEKAAPIKQEAESKEEKEGTKKKADIKELDKKLEEILNQ